MKKLIYTLSIAAIATSCSTLKNNMDSNYKAKAGIGTTLSTADSVMFTGDRKVIAWKGGVPHTIKIVGKMQPVLVKDNK